MSLKLKALGLGLIATLATSAVIATNATAETGGHFTSEVALTFLAGEQVGENELVDPEPGTAMKCKKASFLGTTNAATVTEMTITPSYSECSSGLGVLHVTMNECDYVFTIGKNSGKDNTVHLNCPTGKQVELHQTSAFGTCTYTIKAQTPSGGIAYTTGGSGSTHDITADITLSGIHAERHGGPCAVLPTTTTKLELKGTATFKGYGTQVGITATGSEG